MRLSFAIMLDQQRVVGRTFGARGTLSAVLVDAVGKVHQSWPSTPGSTPELAKVRQVKA